MSLDSVLLLLLLILRLCLLGPLAYFPSELIWNYGTYKQSVGLLGWGISPVAKSPSTHRTTQTQNKLRQTSMPWVGFEPTIPVFERAAAFHALNRAATVIGMIQFRIWVIDADCFSEMCFDIAYFSLLRICKEINACSTITFEIVIRSPYSVDWNCARVGEGDILRPFQNPRPM
jgi:hypothetical protein